MRLIDADKIEYYNDEQGFEIAYKADIDALPTITPPNDPPLVVKEISKSGRLKMKREDLPLVTPEKFKRFNPCWLETREGRARFERIAAVRDEWNALDVLDLEDVSACNKLWSVLREEFLPSMLLHEFACRCAEYALSLVENPDARIVEAIRVKRRWMTGDATDDELMAARDAALVTVEAAESATASVAASVVVRSAKWSARAAASDAAWSAAWSAAWRAEWPAEWEAERAAAEANETAAYEHEVDILYNLINEWEE